MSKLRNVALVGQVGSGKTTLGEALLFRAGTLDRLGRVDDGTASLDFEPEEQRHHQSLSSAFSRLSWRGHDVQIVDTPGASVYLPDSYTCLEAADAALLVLDVSSGIRVQSERLLARAGRLGMPVAVVVTKLDKENVDFAGFMAELGGHLRMKPVALHLPVMEGHHGGGIVDLLHAQAWMGGFDGLDQAQPIPEELAERVAAARKELMECVAETDDALIEHYLEEEELSEQQLEEGFANAFRRGAILPVLTASGAKGIGIDALLDLVVKTFPSPAERPPAVGTSPDGEAERGREPSPDAPFSARVVKTLADPFAGRLTIFRVLSGTLEADSTVANPGRGAKERIGSIFVQIGKKHEPVPKAGPGAIVAVAKLKETLTGDTLCDAADPILYPALDSYPPAITFALEPEARGDEDKIATALHRLQEEDPFLVVDRDPQSAELLISGLGQAHVEVAVEKIERKFGVKVKLQDPKVSYRETIRRRTKVQGRHKRQSGGRGQFGDTWLEIEPLARGGGFEFVDKIVGGAIPRQYIPAVEKGIREAMGRGIYAGFPVVDVRVTLYDGSHHDVDSSDMAFKIAASKGFKKGFKECSPVLLEPVVSMEITVPDECLGDISGDVNRRRGRVIGVESASGSQIIKAQVPQAEVLRYAPELRSLTGDRGDFTMEFSHYEEVPPHVADKIVREHRPHGDEDED